MFPEIPAPYVLLLQMLRLPQQSRFLLAALEEKQGSSERCCLLRQIIYKGPGLRLGLPSIPLAAASKQRPTDVLFAYMHVASCLEGAADVLFAYMHVASCLEGAGGGGGGGEARDP